MFGTSYSMSELAAYNTNVNDRLARKKKEFQPRSQQLDIVIVVDRLLTGFDAPTLSTLFIDRPPMPYKDLIQAFSRTNRIFDKDKRYGQIVTYQYPEKYKDSILMQDSVRDAFGITLKYLGYSLNSTDLDELTEAKNKLIEQKPLVQAYVVDQARDKMIGNEAALAVIYSGEAITCQLENPDLEYVIPKEGSNMWIDSWVIPKNAKNKENAEAFINFMCRPDIAKMNFDYITYSIPNEEGRKLLDPEYRNNPIVFPGIVFLYRTNFIKIISQTFKKTQKIILYINLKEET